MVKKKMPLAMRLLFMFVALVVGGCAGIMFVQSMSGGSATQGPSEAPVEEPEPSVQVFEYDEATVEYGGIQDVAGNAMVTLYLTNRTDATVDVVPENIVVNGQYAVESLTGSVTPIGAGETGAVTLTFGVPVQTPLSGTGDVESLSADLVLVDHSTFERIVYVPVSVTI